MTKQERVANKPGTAQECMVVSINDSNKLRKQKLEKWLRNKMVERYGDARLIDNPLIRICIKFDGLSCEAQHDLFGYAKKRIFGMNQDMKLRDKFWSVIEKGGIEDGTWEDVEEFADQLVLKENTGKKIGYCSKLTL